MCITAKQTRGAVHSFALACIPVIALLAGCAASGEGANPASDGVAQKGAPHASAVLSRALADVIDETVRLQAAEHGRVPRLSGRGDDMRELIDELTLRYPSVLRTTPDEERRLRDGRVDYAARMNELRAISRRVHHERIGLPIVSSYLLRQFESGRLAGARLELAARLLRAQMDDPLLTGRSRDAE